MSCMSCGDGGWGVGDELYEGDNSFMRDELNE